MSSDLTARELWGVYKDAYVQPATIPPLPPHACRMQTLQSALKRDYDAKCPDIAHAKCVLPTAFWLPDVTLAYQTNPMAAGNEDVAGIVIEVVGEKDVWGKNEEKYKGILSAAAALAFMNRSYALFVYAKHAEFYKLTRVPGDGRISLVKVMYTFAMPTHFTELGEELVKAAIDVLITQAPMIRAAKNEYFNRGWGSNRRVGTDTLAHFVKPNVAANAQHPWYPNGICGHIHDVHELDVRRGIDSGVWPGGQPVQPAVMDPY